jgi:hypothetical protein
MRLPNENIPAGNRRHCPCHKPDRTGMARRLATRTENWHAGAAATRAPLPRIRAVGP